MVLHDLWQGGMDVLHDEEWFKEHDIRYVLSLGMHEPAFEIKERLAGHLSIVLEGAVVSLSGQDRSACKSTTAQARTRSPSVQLGARHNMPSSRRSSRRADVPGVDMQQHFVEAIHFIHRARGDVRRLGSARSAEHCSNSCVGG